jgi:hypothetical protein
MRSGVVEKQTVWQHAVFNLMKIASQASDCLTELLPLVGHLFTMAGHWNLVNDLMNLDIQLVMVKCLMATSFTTDLLKS